MVDQHEDETISENPRDSARNTKLRKRICLVGSVADDQDVVNAANLFNVPVETSPTGSELAGDDSWMTYFILSDFEGAIFNHLYSSKVKNK